MRKYLYIIGVVLCLASPVEAKTLYVDAATGNDNTTYANNAAETPWATLGRALWGNANRSTPNAGEAATAGDTVLVTAGTYSAPDTGAEYTPAFNPVNTGSESSKITIQAVGVVNLTSTGTAGGPIIGADGKHGIVWDGFSIDETTYTYLPGIGSQSLCMVRSSNYSEIKNCTFKGGTTTSPNINHAGIFLHNSTHARIYNNTIYNVYGADTNVGAIYTYTTYDSIFEHNEIYNSIDGIFVKAANNANITIRFNKIHDVSYGIRFAANTGANTNIVAYQNLIYNISGIGLLAWGDGALGVSTGCKAVNNTIDNAMAGFGFNNETTQMLFYNNIIHTVSQGYSYSEAYSPTNYPTVHAYEHNLYYSATTKPSWKHESSANLTWGQWQGVGYVHDTVAPAGVYGSDPLFVTNGSNFRLQAGSPALTLGIDILDLDGDGLTNDIIPAGAYITGNEIIGLTTVTPFSFTDVTGAALSTVTVSDNVTVAGIDNTTTLALTGTGCTYSINGAAFATADDNVALSDNVALRVTSSGSYSTAVSCVLTMGGVSDTWYVTTLAAVNDPVAPRMRAGSMTGGWR